ncbi:MAG TPA: dienelactone hydrolase family protein [Chloroflexota bacterium]|nr:dienelactone hydrolase family protein [Chloroflexota bacterium]
MTITTQSVSFRSPDGLDVPAHLARPEGAGPHSAVVMCYELWGMADTPEGGPHMRDVAARFAAAGYVALIPDVYAARGESPRLENGAVVGGPSDEAAQTDLCAAVRWLADQPFVKGDAIGVIGWCGGGRYALFLAARCPNVRAAASFYGRPVNRAITDRQPVSPIDLVPDMACPVFGAYGDADQAIPIEGVRQLEAAFQKAGRAHEIHVYAGAGHAFMNDQRDSYRELAATDAWRRVMRFFGKHLG